MYIHMYVIRDLHEFCRAQPRLYMVGYRVFRGLGPFRVSGSRVQGYVQFKAFEDFRVFGARSSGFWDRRLAYFWVHTLCTGLASVTQ